jgi:hypothetical protein
MGPNRVHPRIARVATTVGGSRGIVSRVVREGNEGLAVQYE